MVVHKTMIKLFHFNLHLERKSCSLPPLEWDMKGCKTSRHAYTHILKFFLADYAGFFKFQISKESLIILSNVLFHAFTKLKQYEQLPENYNSSFKMFCGFSA